jgi:hypothetical protein
VQVDVEPLGPQTGPPPRNIDRPLEHPLVEGLTWRAGEPGRGWRPFLRASRRRGRRSGRGSPLERAAVPFFGHGAPSFLRAALGVETPPPKRQAVPEPEGRRPRRCWHALPLRRPRVEHFTFGPRTKPGDGESRTVDGSIKGAAEYARRDGRLPSLAAAPPDPRSPALRFGRPPRPRLLPEAPRPPRVAKGSSGAERGPKRHLGRMGRGSPRSCEGSYKAPGPGPRRAKGALVLFVKEAGPRVRENAHGPPVNQWSEGHGCGSGTRVFRREKPE